MTIATRTPTTEMEVTSIRFEKELKEKLKELAGNRGYQSLVRDILWDYVNQHSDQARSQISASDICATISAIAQNSDQCYLTGQDIQPQEPILLGLLTSGKLVPLKSDSLSHS